VWFHRWLDPQAKTPRRHTSPGEGSPQASSSSGFGELPAPTSGQGLGRIAEMLGQGAQLERHTLEDAPPDDGQLVFEINTQLSFQLQLMARTHDVPPEALAASLLARGLEQETLRAQAQATLATLTPREQEVTWLTARGHTNRQIAEALVISPETVKSHVRRVLDKFGVRSKADLRLLLLYLGVRWWERA
jgi:DNA-binding CsgD family transcriptional regulator